MKKIFLSLSAIALLAAGAVSCSSSDDSKPTPPEPELTENFVKFNDDEYELFGVEYYLDVDTQDNPYVYTLEGEEGQEDIHYIYYTTYFYTEDIVGAQALNDVELYGYVGYMMIVEPQLDEEGNLIDYSFVWPNEGRTFVDQAIMYNYGNPFGQPQSAILNVNTFVLGESSLTTNIDGSITFDKGIAEFDYNGSAGFDVEPIQDKAAPTAKSIKKVEFINEIKQGAIKFSKEANLKANSKIAGVIVK